MDNESVAIHLFENQYQKSVRSSGLYIDTENCFLGASPDGVVENEDAIVEVKTVPSARNNSKGKKLEEHIEKNKSFCLQIRNSKISLKKTHEYFLQIQGQLNIVKTNKCYFILFVDHDTPLHVEEIARDEEFWMDKMKPKLVSFYHDCILPEIVEPQIPLGKFCRDPKYILEAKEVAEKKKTQRKQKLVVQTNDDETPTKLIKYNKNTAL